MMVPLKPRRYESAVPLLVATSGSLVDAAAPTSEPLVATNRGNLS
jgi:hypothetical protein